MSFNKHLVSTGGTHVLVFIFSLGMSILNARLLGPEGVGVFALLVLLKTLSVRITDLGFGRAFRYYSSNGEIDYYTLKKIVFNVGVVIGIVVVFIGLLLKIAPIGVWNDIDWKVYIVFMPTPFLFVLVMYLRHLLHGQLQIPFINISEILERLLYILLFILFVWYLEMGLVGVSLALSVSTLFLLLQLLRYAQKFNPPSKKSEFSLKTGALIKKLWGYGQWSYYSGFVEYIFMNFPILFLKSTAGSFAQVGFFSKAQGLANYPRIIAVPISGLLFSYNAGSDKNKANIRTEVVCRFSFWAVTILFVTLAFFIKPIIILLYGEAFLPAARVFFFLYPSIVFYIQSLYLSSDIAARGLNKETFTIRLRSLPFILVAAYFLITHYEIIGAAIAISLSFTTLWVQYALKYFSLSGSGFAKILFLKKNDFKLVADLVKNRDRKNIPPKKL